MGLGFGTVWQTIRWISISHQLQCFDHPSCCMSSPFSIFSFKIDVIALRMLHHSCNSFRLTHCCPLWSSTKSQLILESCSITYDWSKKTCALISSILIWQHADISKLPRATFDWWRMDKLTPNGTGGSNWEEDRGHGTPGWPRVGEQGLSCFATKSLWNLV